MFRGGRIMLKKYGWIVALLAAFAMVLIGCPGDGKKDDGFEWDKNVLEVTTKQNWAGIDLTHQASTKGFVFQAGDVILIKGRAASAITIRAQVAMDSNDNLQNWSQAVAAGSFFEKTFTLTADDITKIATGTPQAIRIRANETGKFEIEQILITRGTTELLNLSEFLQTLDVGETDEDTIFDESLGNNGFVPAGGVPAQVGVKVIGPGMVDEGPECTCTAANDCDCDCTADCNDADCPDCEFDFDDAAFLAATGLPLENHWGGRFSLSAGNTVVTRAVDGGNALFSVEVPAAVVDEITNLSSRDGKNIKITYIAIMTKPEVKVTVKTNTSGGDVTPPSYPELSGNGVEASISLALTRYPVEFTFERLFFQDNSGSLAAWKLKIVNIEIVDQ